MAASLPTLATAQQPQWRPSRLPEHNTAQPLAQAANQRATQSAPQAAPSAFMAESANNGEQLGSGVVLRWKTVAPTAASNQAGASASALRQQASEAFAQTSPAASQYDAGGNNPLRSQVMQAAYQQPQGDSRVNPFADESAPATLPPNTNSLPNLPGTLPGSPSQFGSPAAPSLGTPLPQQPNSNFSSPDFQTPNIDPLDTPELSPPPTGIPGVGGDAQNSILDNDRPANPFPNQNGERSPNDAGDEPELLPPPRDSNGKLESPKDKDSASNDLKRRNENANSGYCNEMRQRIHANPITAVSLDISPNYGAGFRAKKDPEQQRLDFASSAIVREWTDYRGYSIVSGRLIDLRDERVVIDVDGREQLIPIRDLSDVDVTYVGEAWNIPERCGTGYDPFQGRNFVPSTVQWAASGLCHKPLYFEQVQLERYGHEIGPVLQPLVSTAHFFGNIPLLPYKMGIHPPNECQYALGYYRPGNCAPYMIQPLPWSLRGAAVQAAVVTGGAALIP